MRHQFHSTEHLGRGRILRGRRVLLLAAAAWLALALVGVAAAQSSQNFDLACRGTVSAAGSVQSLGSMGLVSAVGQPGAGSANSANFAVRGGYVQPSSRLGQNTQAATVDAGGNRYLPFVADALARIVRPCVW